MFPSTCLARVHPGQKYLHDSKDDRRSEEGALTMPDTGRPVTPRQFGQWLELTMANAEITGKQLAEAAHLDEAQVSRWKRGKGKPSLESCERLAEALKVDPMRLAVTAGAVPRRMAGAEPLPMPPNTAAIEHARRALRALPGATEDLAAEMLAVYKRRIEEGW